MCLIALQFQPESPVRLRIAANRDEFHDRPAESAGWWADHPEVCGGRDGLAGGSWMAVNRAGRLAAVTNVRRMQAPAPGAPSRGELVTGFLASSDPAPAWLEALARHADQYAGFNLLVDDGRALYWASNADGFRSRRIEAGVHTISNASLDTPWPKSRRLHAALAAARLDDDEALFEALADRRPADDDELPDTGIGIELERLLSAPFIVSPRYGTRASTVITTGGGRLLALEERRFDAAGHCTGRVRLGSSAPAAVSDQ